MEMQAAQAPRQLPPGFRFHPTDEELVVQYLRRKALSSPLPAAVIPVVHDVAGLDPWDLPGASEGEGYFFSLRREPAAGGGQRRRAGTGYWKATGKAKPVFLQGPGCGGGGYLVGIRTALTFHHGKPARGSPRTGWAMHEFRLAVPGGVAVAEQRKNASQCCVVRAGEWVVCRVFPKNRSRSKMSQEDAAGSQAPGNRASLAHRTAPPLQHQLDAGRLRPLLLSPPSLPSSSCVTGVTDISDQDEVSSSRSVRDAAGAGASQRAA